MLSKSNYFKLLLLFVAVFLFFFWLSNFDKFADPDSFYHVKITEILMRGNPEAPLGAGILREFPFLPFTTLAGAFADQHFLYHASLVPFFVIFKNHFFLTKIAANFFAALIFILFYWLLGKLKIKWKIFYVLVLLSSSTFIFRMNSPKAGVLSVILMLLLFWVIWEKKYWAIVLCSFLWVWAHASWPMALVLAACYVLASLFSLEEKFFSLKRIVSAANIKIIIAIVSGIVLGIVANPYFPQNILFYWAQVFKIGFLNYAYKFGVGSEWYPPSFLEMISRTGLVLPLLVFAVFIFILGAVLKKKDYVLPKDEFKKVVFLGFFAVLTFLLALKSRRNIEYFVPTATLFGAILDNLGASALDKNFIKEFLDKLFRKMHLKILAVFLAACFGASLGYVFYYNIFIVRSFFQNGFSWGRLQKVSEFLKNHSAAGEIVFNGDWDDFPALFYFNDKNYYISGLDPTFLYLKNKDLFEKYNQISSDKETPDLYQIIKNNFKAKYAVIDKKHPKIKIKFSNDKGFELVYEDEEAWIYSIK